MEKIMSLYVLGFNIAIFIVFNLLTLPVLDTNNLVLSYNSAHYPLSFILNNYTHNDLLHILFNMIILYQFGSLADKIYNKNQQITLYFFSGICISMIMFAYIKFIDPLFAMKGFSGIACFLIGCVYMHLDKMNARNILIMLGLYHVIVIAAGLPVAWQAHLIGGVLGYLYSIYVTYDKNKPKKKKKIKHNFKIIK
jgi:membrane associated rhomboid family serine protease